jgi:cytoplasmic iron level regulating protein YaaA (DUF328/UPF0246 family)
MLLIVPSSEGKQSPQRGAPLDLATLSFPELTELRRTLLAALIATSSASDALARLGIPAARATLLAQQRVLYETPTAPAHEVYTGVLHRALDYGSLGLAERERATRILCFSSPLYGLLRPEDAIAPYRLAVTARLLGSASLATLWSSQLPRVLRTALGERGLIVDLRAASHRALGTLVAPTVQVATIACAAGTSGGNVALKQLRGAVARHLLCASEETEDLPMLIDQLSTRWRVAVLPALSAEKPVTLLLAP